MPKNYTIQYLGVLKNMLEDAAAEVETLIEQADTGEGDNPSDARKSIRGKMKEIDTRFIQLSADARQMTYTDFKTKYIERL